jgi:hypothetical protein
MMATSFIFSEGTHRLLNTLSASYSRYHNLPCVFFSLDPSLTSSQKAILFPYLASPRRAPLPIPRRKTLEAELIVTIGARNMIASIAQLNHSIALGALLPPVLSCHLEKECIIAIDNSSIFNAGISWMRDRLAEYAQHSITNADEFS